MTAKLISPFYSTQRNPPLPYTLYIQLCLLQTSKIDVTLRRLIYSSCGGSETEIETDLSLALTARSPAAREQLFAPHLMNANSARNHPPSAFLQS